MTVNLGLEQAEQYIHTRAPEHFPLLHQARSVYGSVGTTLEASTSSAKAVEITCVLSVLLDAARSLRSLIQLMLHRG